MATINCVNNNTFTSATAITITSGDLAVSSGNVTLANATSSVGQITWGGTAYIHNYTTRNFFAGQGAGNFTNTSSDNTGLGYLALSSLTTGSAGAGQNAACGSGSSQAMTSGFNNASFGYNSLNLATTGNGNSAFGSGSLSALVGGSTNTALGYNSGNAYTGSESNNITIMNAGTAAESNVCRIGTEGTGSGQVSTCYIAGIRNATVTGSAVLVSTSGQLGLVASSIRFKENVEDMGDSSSPVMKLRPVTFNYNFGNPEENAIRQFGLIAEEVEKIMPELVGYNDKGQIQTVHYHVLPSILLNEMQKQQKLIDRLESMISELEKEKK